MAKPDPNKAVPASYTPAQAFEDGVASQGKIAALHWASGYREGFSDGFRDAVRGMSNTRIK